MIITEFELKSKFPGNLKSFSFVENYERMGNRDCTGFVRLYYGS